jgi:signal peptidase I
MNVLEKIREFRNKHSKQEKPLWREYAEAIVTALILALIIRTYVVQAFKIPSGSMLETLQIGDHILVNKFIYTFREPKRGDIIVFKYPKDPDRDFIKRVIGLPGEILEIKHQQIYINNKPLNEDYVVHTDLENNNISPRDNMKAFEIPLDCVFVMGDNRDSSMDSRYWGPLNLDMILGRAFMIYWSIEPYEVNQNDPLLLNMFHYISGIPGRVRWSRAGDLIH